MTGAVRAAGRERTAESVLRRGLLALALVATVGTWVELGISRHWDTPVQVLPWAAVGLVGAAAIVVAVRPGRGAIRLARGVSAVAIVAGLYGVYEHVESNYDSGPLDAVYGARWDSMGELSRWWHALVESVGPSPTFAPGALALTAACLLLATLRHPALVDAPPALDEGGLSVAP